MTGKQQPVEQLSFEAALGELETIVRGLEKGDTALEDSITAYERGAALKKHCEKKLREAQSKIEKISVNDDGTVSTVPFTEQG
jgi:exodeoxyribonuclease VII small subunit